MAVGVDTLVIGDDHAAACPFNCAWLGPCRADEAYAMLYSVSCEYIATAWFVVAGANSKAVLGGPPNRAQALCAPSSSFARPSS